MLSMLSRKWEVSGYQQEQSDLFRSANEEQVIDRSINCRRKKPCKMTARSTKKRATREKERCLNTEMPT